MNLFDRIMLRRGERVLLPFRSNESTLLTPSFQNYSDYLPLIKTYYESAAYWHGTGRYQYAHAHDYRYGGIDFTKHIDVLALILQEGGLTPHHEPWLKKIHKIYAPTISITPFRMYARLYAGLYLYETDALSYEFGTTKFWFKFLRLLQTTNRKFLWFFMTKGIFKLISFSSYKDVQKYVSSFRSDLDTKPINPLRGHLIRTDIAENYPILIGIKKNIKITPFNAGMERLELRTNEPVFLKDMTHIEVPLNKVKETENFLHQQNISLPVVPLEFGELYCSKYQLKKLIGK